MNKIILTLFLLISGISFGQQKPDWEKIKSLKVAFITEKLSLTSKEAQSFWPVYNEFEEKRDALRKKEHTEIRSKMDNLDALSESEANSLLQQHMKLEIEEEELQNSFLKEVKEVISAKKTLLLMRSEEDFKRQLIRQYRHNKGGK